MNPLILLLLILAARGRGGRGNAPSGKKDPFDFTPSKPVPVTAAPGFDVVPTSFDSGKPGGRALSKWVPYAPLIPEVIERASQILNQRGAKEIIEPDPADKTRVVRYLRTTDSPPGHVQVTAWRARDGKPATVKS